MEYLLIVLAGIGAGFCVDRYIQHRQRKLREAGEKVLAEERRKSASPPLPLPDLRPHNEEAMLWTLYHRQALVKTWRTARQRWYEFSEPLPQTATNLYYSGHLPAEQSMQVRSLQAGLILPNNPNETVRREISLLMKYGELRICLLDKIMVSMPLSHVAVRENYVGGKGDLPIQGCSRPLLLTIPRGATFLLELYAPTIPLPLARKAFPKGKITLTFYFSGYLLRPIQ